MVMFGCSLLWLSLVFGCANAQQQHTTAWGTGLGLALSNSFHAEPYDDTDDRVASWLLLSSACGAGEVCFRQQALLLSSETKTKTNTPDNEAVDAVVTADKLYAWIAKDSQWVDLVLPNHHYDHYDHQQQQEMESSCGCGGVGHKINMACLSGGMMITEAAHALQEQEEEEEEDPEEDERRLKDSGKKSVGASGKKIVKDSSVGKKSVSGKKSVKEGGGSGKSAAVGKKSVTTGGTSTDKDATSGEGSTGGSAGAGSGEGSAGAGGEGSTGSTAATSSTSATTTTSTTTTTTTTTPGPVCETCCGGTTQSTISRAATSCIFDNMRYSRVQVSDSGSGALACYALTKSFGGGYYTIDISSLYFPQPACQIAPERSMPPTRQRRAVRQRLLLPDREDGKDNDEEEDTQIPMPRHASVAAFLRVPKTGSTTMLQYLFQTPGLFPWNEHLSKPLLGEDGKRSAMAAASSCVYGSVATTAHLGANFHHHRGHDEQDHSGGAAAAGGGWNACPHIPYPNLVQQWSKTLDSHWEPPKTAVFEKDAVPGNFSFGLRTFSMVRDPFDRLLSFYFYLQSFVDSKSQFLKQTVTEEQYERVKAGDLYGWMELLHEQGGGCGLQLPFQYRYFHQDLDTALSLIQEDEETGEAPKIFVMVTECYEPSLRLLAEHFEEFEPESVDKFVSSPSYRTNKNKKSLTNKASYQKKDQDRHGLENLRELAMDWFKDDFTFYDAAVKQFQNYMTASQLDPIHFESCTFWNAAGGGGVDGVASLLAQKCKSKAGKQNKTAKQQNNKRTTNQKRCAVHDA